MAAPARRGAPVAGAMAVGMVEGAMVAGAVNRSAVSHVFKIDLHSPVSTAKAGNK